MTAQNRSTACACVLALEDINVFVKALHCLNFNLHTKQFVFYLGRFRRDGSYTWGR